MSFARISFSKSFRCQNVSSDDFVHICSFLSQTNRIHHDIRMQLYSLYRIEDRKNINKDEFDKNRNLPSIGNADMIQKIIDSSQPNDQ